MTALSAYRKDGALGAHEFLRSFALGNIVDPRPLASWCAQVNGECNDPAFIKLNDAVSALPGQPSARAVLALRPLAEELIRQWLPELNVELYLGQGLPPIESLPLMNGAGHPAADCAAVPSDGTIRILLSAGGSTAENNKFDLETTLGEITQWARFCFPITAFDYDRAYLSGKINSLKGKNSGAGIVLAGSSYTMVGLLEGAMPRAAINLAINSQDPYFALLSVNRAVGLCPGISTIVLSSAYYFWHSVLADSPSDYSRAILWRVNAPVLGGVNGWNGESPDLCQRVASLPLLETVFDFMAARNAELQTLSDKLGYLPYYNMFNPRPKNGMLQFPFRQQPDEMNYNTARIRASAHGKSFSDSHLQKNMELLGEFMRTTGKSRRTILFVPPVTRFYRAGSLPELKSEFYKYLEPVRQKYGFEFVDLMDSPDFTDEDFQDYDHLNARGAEKLSGIIAGMVRGGA